MDSQKRHARQFSLELFPPKTAAGADKLKRAHGAFAALGPAFVSVTYGAGGSTRDRTYNTVEMLHRAGSTPVAPHISGMGASRAEMLELLQRYRQLGIKRLVALRGDLPSDMVTGGDFPQAIDLVRFIRQETGSHFTIEVAAYPEFHPEATSPEADIGYFREKIGAGANSALTQYFFTAQAYFRFIDSLEKVGVDLPVVPGIMPITNFTQLDRFSRICGAEIPRWLRLRLQAMETDEAALADYGQDVIQALCEELLAAGAPGLHFYALNRLEPTRTLWNHLGLNSLAGRPA
ncbi:MAG: methylenetetrahydrofolate reductase [NAD(P)H] [Gammaproteobacteria bacterium]|nr:methylenetetrahydrofolate reductase [NAD(P)H] [Gammaproteobacteria bacterium]